MPESLKGPTKAPKETGHSLLGKSNGSHFVAMTAVPLVNEEQLSAATGGAETSCYRCLVPFGVVILIAGVVVTAVAYRFNAHGSVISVFGLVLLSTGLLLLCSSAVCWKARAKGRRDRRRESQTALIST